jgi:hypothetical protein
MPEEKKVVTSELNIFFNERGEIGMGGGLHIKLLVPGTPTVETIQALVDRVHEWGVGQEPVETGQDKAETPPRDDSALDLHCPRTGVWAAAKGNWPEGLKPDWKHNDPRMNKQGIWYCPTPVGKDKVTGQLIWCTWRARELEDGTYQEFDANKKEPE